MTDDNRAAVSWPYQLACYNDDYAQWYTDENRGGRHAITVGELKKLLDKFPESMPVKVSHQYDRHPVGIHDPICRPQEIAVVVGVTERGAPIMGRAEGGLVYFVIE